MTHSCRSISREQKTVAKGRKKSCLLYKCGSCHCAFPTICVLHEHCNQHVEGGSYFYNNLTQTAYPKFDTVCAFTQVNEELLNLEWSHRTDETSVKPTAVMVNIGSTQYKRETPTRQSKSQAKLNKIWVTTIKRHRKHSISESEKRQKEHGNESELLSNSQVIPITTRTINYIEDTDRTDLVVDKALKRIAGQDEHDADISHEKSQVDNSENASDIDKNTVKTLTNESTSNPSGVKKRSGKHNKNVFATTDQRECESTKQVKDSHKSDEMTASEVLIAISKGVLTDTIDTTQKCGENEGNTVNQTEEKLTVNSKPDIETEKEQNEKSTSTYPEICFDSIEVEEQPEGLIMDADCQMSIHKNIKKTKTRKKSVSKDSKNIQHKCPICGKTGSQTLMYYHKFMHVDRKNFTCEKCGSSFKHPRCLQMHQKQHGEKQFRCTLCPEAFYRKQYLRTHMLKHSGEEPYQCDICGKSYREKNNLTRHVRHVHEKVRNYECDICGERFFRSDHLKNHRLRHAEADKRCPFCPRLFKHPDDLLRHTKTHTGEKKWHCNICGHGFVSVSPYYVHMLKKHGMNREDAKELKSKLQADHKLRLSGVPVDIKPVIPVLTKDVSCQSGQYGVQSGVRQTANSEDDTAPVTITVEENNKNYSDIVEVYMPVTTMSYPGEIQNTGTEVEEVASINLNPNQIIEQNSHGSRVTQYLLDLGNHEMGGNQTVVLEEGISSEIVINQVDVGTSVLDDGNISTIMLLDSNQIAEEVII